MPTNRERSLRAAVEILATGGIRALTHRRVDEQAGLPEGSTSNSFRTRGALLGGVTSHMVAAELPHVARTHTADSPEALADALVELFAQQVGPMRTLTAARLALYVEAGHDEVIREALARGRRDMLTPIRAALDELGARDPELAVRLLGACFQGLFLQVLGGYADIDPRPVIHAAVRAATAG